MLQNIHIQNYALIDQLDIEFNQGLNIITGETGAGKSILLGALSLILGQRADTSALKDSSKSCVVEGLFDIASYNLKPFFIENDIDYYDNTIIRRQINESGKSRAFINETPVNLNVLKDLGALLIDIHSQHESLLLGNGQFQLNVLDSFANLGNDLSAYQEIYKRYNGAKIELEKLILESVNSRKDFDYFQFQLNELNMARLKPDELQDLEVLQQQLAHANEIKCSLQSVSDLLSNDSSSAITLLKEVEQNLKKIFSFFPESVDLEKRVEACRIEMKDISNEVASHNDRVEADPQQLEIVTSRLDLLYSLLQKHKLTTVDELISLRNEIESKVDFISNIDFNLEQKQKQLAELETQVGAIAIKLSEKRKKVLPLIENSITELLVLLGIKHAAFKVDIQKSETFLSNGIDKVSFLFSANKQIPLQELSKVASGGELSRLMLSLKSLTVKSSGLPTIIFDEIDTGVSGEIADKVGNIIHGMANGMQVINITHLPQIASKGKTHFLVYKDSLSAHSNTKIKLLDSNERVVEIAKMLSGEKLSDAALTNAKELLSMNGN
ncbi:MAG: DNA repair protein RecN [Bacteroidales bacterium]|nr:MAG: DNA repair protein RecN [Bacteroidales bacterium]